MGVKILLADDSPTVHKVIKIILANEPYEVIECGREADLLPMLAKHNASVVFLDFNFSENLTGYDLCRSIKQQNPSAKVLMMYGTFDAIEENILRESGADQHVVKPFDTNRFIFQVRALADSSSPEPADDWSLQESTEMESPDVVEMTKETFGSLDSSLSDWGMMVPGVIGQADASPELPPVIENNPAPIRDNTAGAGGLVAHQAHAPEGAGPVIPVDQDLEYPDMGLSLELEETPKPKSRLVALNELLAEESEEKHNSIELMSYSGMDEDVKKIEAQIQDEMEADLWSVDSFEETNPKLAVVKNKNLEDLEEAPAPSISPTPTTNNISMDIDSLRPLLQEMVRQAVREYCQQHVDKVAWEVIPDLAENLIRKELQEMARKATQD